jgi:hypothetical protein
MQISGICFSEEGSRTDINSIPFDVIVQAAGESIADILNNGGRDYRPQNGSRKRAFQASNWNIVSRMPRRPKPIQWMIVSIVLVSFDKELRSSAELRLRWLVGPAFHESPFPNIRCTWRHSRASQITVDMK